MRDLAQVVEHIHDSEIEVLEGTYVKFTPVGAEIPANPCADLMPQTADAALAALSAWMLALADVCSSE